MKNKNHSSVHGAWVIIFGSIYFITSWLYYPVSCLINRYCRNILACNFLKLSGIECPTCGASRAAYHFITGDFQKSFHYHPAVFMMSAYVLLTIIYAVYKITVGQKISIPYRFHKYLFIVLFGITLIFWLMKLFL